MCGRTGSLSVATHTRVAVGHCAAVDFESRDGVDELVSVVDHLARMLGVSESFTVTGSYLYCGHDSVDRSPEPMRPWGIGVCNSR